MFVWPVGGGRNLSISFLEGYTKQEISNLASCIMITSIEELYIFFNRSVFLAFYNYNTVTLTMYK